MKKIIPVLLAAAALLAASCGLRTQVNPDAFGPKKTFAVVSVEAQSHVLENLGKGKTGLGADTILEKAKIVVLSELIKSPRFRLMSERRVLANKEYRNYPDGDITKTAGADFIAAKGYKLSSDLKNKEWYAKLARDLNVDGTMVISMSFTPAPAPSGNWKVVITTLALYVFDRDGNVVARVVESNGGHYGRAVKNELLRSEMQEPTEPLMKELLLSTHDAAAKLLARFDLALMNAKAKQEKYKK